MDYFLARYPSTPVDALLVHLVPYINVTACTAITLDATFPPAPASSATHTLLWLDPVPLSKPCDNYARMARLVSKLTDQLVAKGYPNRVELVLGSAHGKGKINGSPMDDPYQARVFGQEDGEPVLPIAIVSPIDAASIDSITHGATVVVRLEHEPGQWTLAYTSIAYLMYRIFLWLVNGLVVLIACGRLMVADYTRKNAGMLLLYVFNIIAGICLLAQLGISVATFKYRVLDYYVGWMHAFSFVVVVFTWINMLKRYGIESTSQFVHFVIQFALAVSLLRFLHIIAELTGLNLSIRELIQAFFWMVLAPTQYLTAVLFLYYAVRFYRRREKTKQELRPETLLTLNRLVYLSLAGVFCNLCIGALNQVYTNVKLMTMVNYVMLVSVTRFLVSTVRSMALLLLLGLGSKVTLVREWEMLLGRLGLSVKNPL
jgi:hypothetical protein